MSQQPKSNTRPRNTMPLWLYLSGGLLAVAGLTALLLFQCQPSPATEPPPQEDSTPAADATRRPPPTPVEMRCNGWLALCPKTFDQVAFLTTHNAMSNADEKWQIPNQHHTILKQLDNGVRGLMLDVHPHEGKPYLCHGPCLLGKKELTQGLHEIEDWLNTHPHEVITIIFESYVSAAEIKTAFETSKLLSFVYAHPKGSPWPTLRAMIEKGHRLLVLTDREGGTYPWYHDVWQYAWETHYAAATASDFSCQKNRGDQANALFIFNHFLTNPVAKSEFAEKVNKNPLLMDRVQECKAQSGKMPNFITVDFYDIGDALKVVNTLNEVQ